MKTQESLHFSLHCGKKLKQTTNKTFGRRNGLKLRPPQPQPQVLNLRLWPQNFGLWSNTAFLFSFFTQLPILLYRIVFFLTSYLSIECTIIILICIESVSNASRFRDASINPLDSRLPLLHGSMIMTSYQLGVFCKNLHTVPYLRYHCVPKKHSLA